MAYKKYLKLGQRKKDTITACLVFLPFVALLIYGLIIHFIQRNQLNYILVLLLLLILLFVLSTTRTNRRLYISKRGILSLRKKSGSILVFNVQWNEIEQISYTLVHRQHSLRIITKSNHYGFRNETKGKEFEINLEKYESVSLSSSVPSDFLKDTLAYYCYKHGISYYYNYRRVDLGKKGFRRLEEVE